jgi:hypothetical protein
MQTGLKKCRVGAETGAGGRIRDTHATGTGSMMGASTAGYCVGNLQLDGVEAPWEDTSFVYPDSLASPLQVQLGITAFITVLEILGNSMANLLLGPASDTRKVESSIP